MVKIIGIVGSPRKDGNTENLVKEALNAAEKVGVETELISLASAEIEPCIACDICKATGECAIYDDVPAYCQKLLIHRVLSLEAQFILEMLQDNLKC